MKTNRALYGDTKAVLLCVLAALSVGLLLGTSSGRAFLAPVGGIALFVLLVWDIRLVVPVLLVSLPFGPKFAFDFGNLYLSTGILLIAYLAWAVRIPAGGGGFTFRTGPILWAVLAFMTAFVISSLQSYDRLTADVPHFMKFVQFLLYTGIFVLVYQMEFSRTQIKRLLIFMLLVGLAQGAYGAVQWITDPGYFVVGTFDQQHNLYASYVIFITLLFIGVALAAGRASVLIGAMAAAGIIIYSIIFSYSRTGYVSLLVATLFFMFLPIGRIRKLAVSAVSGLLVVSVLVMVPASVSERMREIYTTAAGTYITLSFKIRMMMWKEAFEDWKSTPIFGQGAWAYGMRDNFFVKAGAEAGLVGLTTYLVLLYFLMRTSWRLVKSPPADDFMRGIVTGLFPALGAIIVFNMAGDSMSIHRFMGVFWIALALTLQYCSGEGGRPEGCRQVSGQARN